MDKIRIAVVGAGRLGGFHAQKLAKRGDVELVGIIDPVQAACQRVAAECQTTAYADCSEIIGRIDAAVVATPTIYHFDIAKRLLDAGVHLLVEKPLCPSKAEADILVSTANRRGLTLQVGHVERFNPAFSAAASAITSPKYIEAVRASGYTFRSTDIGVVHDLMIHDIDLVLSLVDSPLRKVDALGVSLLGSHEDVANARLEFECGCVATLSASRVSYEAARHMQVWAVGAFAGIDFATRRATLVRPSEALLARQFDVDRLSPDEVGHYRDHFAEEHLPREELVFDAIDALALEHDDFIGSIASGREPRVSGEAGRNALAVAEAILDRIDAHCWDSSIDGPAGPFFTPRRHVIPAPHFDIPAAAKLREKAG